jgi:Plasmid maintenance system killer protein
LDDDLWRLYVEPDFHLKRLGPDLVRVYRKQVGLLASVGSEAGLRNFKGLRLERLKGDRAGEYSIRLNEQWRLILQFRTDDDGKSVVVIEIVDYH